METNRENSENIFFSILKLAIFKSKIKFLGYRDDD